MDLIEGEDCFAQIASVELKSMPLGTSGSTFVAFQRDEVHLFFFASLVTFTICNVLAERIQFRQIRLHPQVHFQRSWSCKWTSWRRWLWRRIYPGGYWTIPARLYEGVPIGSFPHGNIIFYPHLTKFTPKSTQVWDALPTESERVDDYGLGIRKSLDEAVDAVMLTLGLQPCEGTDVVPPGARSHTTLLSGLFVGDIPILIQMKLGIDSSGDVAMKLTVRAEEIVLSELVHTLVSEAWNGMLKLLFKHQTLSSLNNECRCPNSRVLTLIIFKFHSARLHCLPSRTAPPVHHWIARENVCVPDSQLQKSMLLHTPRLFRALVACCPSFVSTLSGQAS